MTLDSTALVACPALAFISQGSGRRRPSLIGIEYILVGILPTYSSEKRMEEAGSGENEGRSLHGSICMMTMSLESAVPVPAYLVGREQRVSGFHKVIRVVVVRVQECELNKIVLK